MKYFIVSDIHGSVHWAQKVVEAFDQSGADLLVILGDVYYHGPRNPLPTEYLPASVSSILAPYANKIVAIRGNCDSSVDQMVSNFTFLENNILPLGNRKVFLTHGHVYNKDNLPHLAQGDLLIYGHFHKNEIVNKEGVICVNVGSPSLPKDGLSTYCVLSEEGIVINTFDGQIVLNHPFN